MRETLSRLGRTAIKLEGQWLFPVLHPFAPRFECPLCAYRSPLRKVTPSTGTPQYAQVELLHSSQAPDLLHTSIYQDRTGWPNELSPLHPPMSGQWQRDIVPVCSTQQGSESN